MNHDGSGVYKDIPQDIPVTRYHSLAAPIEKLPKELIPTSFSKSNASSVVMGVRHQVYTLEGVQFHPESIMTEHGMKMLSNFLQVTGGTWEENAKNKQ